MRRRGFTLIELLTVVAIMGTMVTVGIVSYTSNRGAARIKGAARDVLATLRRARSVALITQKPVVVTYSNSTVDGETLARIEVKSEQLFKVGRPRGAVENLAGEVVREAESGETGDSGAGETIADVLAPSEMPADVMQGLKLKTLLDDEKLAGEELVRVSRISIFSTVDSVSRTYTVGDEEEKKRPSDGENAEEDAPRSVVFQANGTVDHPHRVYVYRETSTPESGFCIEVDRFGDVIIKGDGEEK